MTENPELIMRQPRERLACQRRLETPRLSQVFEKSGRLKEFQFPRAASQAVRTATKRSGPAAKARGRAPCSGRGASGEEALRRGLANRLVPTGEALKNAVWLAHEIARSPQSRM